MKREVNVKSWAMWNLFYFSLRVESSSLQ
uniref:Uncharacterized protein n=1 Tax=Arundo donax TaxID=35708 RepID=A0A0A9BUP5_ARUDO